MKLVSRLVGKDAIINLTQCLNYLKSLVIKSSINITFDETIKILENGKFFKIV